MIVSFIGIKSIGFAQKSDKYNTNQQKYIIQMIQLINYY